MSMIILKRVDSNGRVSISTLSHSYPKLCATGNSLMCFINRVFNEERKIIRAHRRTLELPIIVTEASRSTYCDLDVSDFTRRSGIPVNYFVEVIASNFLAREGSEEKDLLMIPIFPDEIRVDCDAAFEEMVSDETSKIQNIADTYETVGRLHHLGFGEISDDLREAVLRLENRDTDGSVKFSRRAVEGLKQRVDQDILQSPNRVEAFNRYLGKAFHLMSNFGEHAGTEALFHEAVLAKDIAISAARYVVAKSEQ